MQDETNRSNKIERHPFKREDAEGENIPAASLRTSAEEVETNESVTAEVKVQAKANTDARTVAAPKVTPSIEPKMTTQPNSMKCQKEKEIQKKSKMQNWKKAKT